jgi:hypothetical protein
VAAWVARISITCSGGTLGDSRADEEVAEAAEEEADFVQALVAFKKDAAEKARATAEEQPAAISTLRELQMREDQE